MALKKMVTMERPKGCSLLKVGTSRRGQRHTQARAPERRGTGGDPAVVEHDDFLHECEAKAGAAAFRGEERLKDAFASDRVYAGTVVIDGDVRDTPFLINLRSHHDYGRSRRLTAGFHGIPKQVAERLTQEHFVSLEPAEGTLDGHVAAGRSRIRTNFFCDALTDGSKVHIGKRELRRPSKIQKIGHDFAERIGLGADA